MASQHNRTSSYRALIDGNKTVATTFEEVMHEKVMGAVGEGERKPHGLPPPEVLNEELKTLKVNPRSKSSIAGANSSTFHIYRANRREERERIERMYQSASKEQESKDFQERKRQREDEEASKTASRASKRQKKKDAAAERKKKAASAKAAPQELAPPGPPAAAAAAEKPAEQAAKETKES
eukprot:TRINITY_DN20468_c0_g1_i1.p1 TRINITY_DN20468_c0_g1~~TRINITY_DN20468_c0_g1_i1.p1  ORF type:complete len:196 (+),score=52.63 TRINITY_DN20468_c0_g1_i1:46-588(+)